MKSFIIWTLLTLALCGSIYMGLIKQERIYQESQV